MEPSGPSRTQAPEMFDRISGTYDLLNHVLSFGLDFYWRKQVAGYLQAHHRKILDCATGTGDQLLAVMQKSSPQTEAWGVDPAVNMLSLAEQKFASTPFVKRAHFLPGKADSLPFENQFFDFITMSFGIRNVEHVDAALKELRRVLHKDGTLVLLEFSLPSSSLVRFGHTFYLKHVVPILGKCIAKDVSAYRYLADTIAKFPYGDQFCDLLRQAGFSDCKAYPLTLGITTIYVAR